MKKPIALLLSLLMLTGCAANPVAETTSPADDSAKTSAAADASPAEPLPAPEYVTRFDSETVITLSDNGITVNSGEETESVYTSHDIIYYEDKNFYDSGNPYGEGSDADRHTVEEAAMHTVINITAPGAYRVSGKLSAGQLRIDLGEDAYEDPNAVVELILDNADITCTVAPAILFLSTYECDGNWSVETARSDVDTSAAGANLILAGENRVTGSHVAKIFQDTAGEKKLWKQDGAVYSYMSLNVFGPGALELNADNEGMDTELHLTINGGSIDILSGNDGINTNEDGVSVTTINGGDLHIIAGTGEEGDGIDSNGYLVINGGTVISFANPAADAGLDSDLGSYVNGGTVIALGSTMDWAESDSNQVTMNLQFADFQSGAIEVKKGDGTTIFAYDPDEDEILMSRQQSNRYMGAILSCPDFAQGETYTVYLDGIQMMYTGTDVTMMSGGMGGFGGRGMGTQRPDGEMSELPEDWQPDDARELPDGETFPEDFDPDSFGGRGRNGEIPEGERPEMPEGFDGEMPDGITGQRPELPEGETMPADFAPGGFDGKGQMEQSGNANTEFYMQDKVNCFSGVTAVTE